MPSLDNNVSNLRPPRSEEMKKLIEIHKQVIDNGDWNKIFMSVGSVEVDGEIYIKSVVFETRTENGEPVLYSRLSYAKVDLNNISSLYDRKSYVESLPISKNGIAPIHRDVNDDVKKLVLGIGQKIEVNTKDLFDLVKNKFSISPATYEGSGCLQPEIEKKQFQSSFLDFLRLPDITPTDNPGNDEKTQHP